METDKPKPKNGLRRQAEAFLHQNPMVIPKMPPEEIQKLVHEIQVHQIELEMQNQELRRTQGELEESRGRYVDLFDFAPVGYFLLDQTGMIREVNLTGARLLGVDRSGLLKSGFSRFIAQQGMDAFFAYRKAVFQTRMEQTCELPLLKADGSEFPAQLTSIALADAQGEYNQLRTIVMDITARKQAEEQREELVRVTAKNEELENIMHVVGHDLRGPLVTITGFSEILSKTCDKLRQALGQQKLPSSLQTLLEETFEKEIPKILGYIRPSIREMDTVLRGLVTLARLGQGALEIQEIDMDGLLGDLIKARQGQIQEARATIECEKLPGCRGDVAQITQVFGNLLGNALKFLDPARPGCIHISGHKDTDGNVYSIRDNGVGIAEHNRKLIFKIFFRVDGFVGEAGEGLGLNIVQRIVNRHGGRVWLESQVGQGSTFHVFLPEK